MKRLLRVFGKLVSILFQAIMAYIFMVLLAVGFETWLWWAVGLAIVGISFDMVELLAIIGEDTKEVEKKLDEVKPPLYYRIEQDANGDWSYLVYSQNHELICRSDEFLTHDGAMTGLWYLMEAMKRMSHDTWKDKHSN